MGAHTGTVPRGSRPGPTRKLLTDGGSCHGIHSEVLSTWLLRSFEGRIKPSSSTETTQEHPLAPTWFFLPPGLPSSFPATTPQEGFPKPTNCMQVFWSALLSESSSRRLTSSGLSFSDATAYQFSSVVCKPLILGSAPSLLLLAGPTQCG